MRFSIGITISILHFNGLSLGEFWGGSFKPIITQHFQCAAISSKWCHYSKVLTTKVVLPDNHQSYFFQLFKNEFFLISKYYRVIAFFKPQCFSSTNFNFKCILVQQGTHIHDAHSKKICMYTYRPLEFQLYIPRDHLEQKMRIREIIN